MKKLKLLPATRPLPSAPRKRGFAAMSPSKRRDIARLGGQSHSVKHLREIGARGGAAKAKPAKCSAQ